MQGPTGPQGPTGATGAKGDAGATVATGAGGIAGSNFYVRTAAGAAQANATASCDTGDLATGGGVNVTAANGGNNQEVQRSAPARNGVLATSGQQPNGWIGESSLAFTVYVICADTAP